MQLHAPREHWVWRGFIIEPLSEDQLSPKEPRLYFSELEVRYLVAGVLNRDGPLEVSCEAAVVRVAVPMVVVSVVLLVSLRKY